MRYKARMRPMHTSNKKSLAYIQVAKVVDLLAALFNHMNLIDGWI